MVKYLVFKVFVCTEQVVTDVAVQVTYPPVLFCKSFLSSPSPRSASAVTHPSVLPGPWGKKDHGAS